MSPDRRLVLLASMLAVSLTWGLALAHGEGGLLYQGTEGPYEITVRMQPETAVVGVMHFSVTPLDPQTRALILGVRVDLVAHDPQGEPAYRVQAVSSPASPQYYDANITIESPGAWTLRVNVSDDDRGDATFVVPLSVGGSAPVAGTAGTVVWLGVIGILLAGAVYIWIRSRRLLSSGRDDLSPEALPPADAEGL